MSQKEAHRPGLVRAAEKGKLTNAQGATALGLVIAQGVLGGLTVLFYLPPAISSAHAALAQTYIGTPIRTVRVRYSVVAWANGVRMDRSN